MKKLFVIMVMCLGLIFPAMVSAQLKCAGDNMTENESLVVGVINDVVSEYAKNIESRTSIMEPLDVQTAVRDDLQRMADSLIEERLVQSIAGRVIIYKEGDVWIEMLIVPTADKNLVCGVQVRVRQKD